MSKSKKTKVNIAPVGVPEVELTAMEPEDVTAGMTEYETALMTLQRNEDVALIEGLLVEKQKAMELTGPRVSAEANPLGALTQKGLEQAIQAYHSAINTLKNASLAKVKYDDDADTPTFDEDDFLEDETP